jgi:hypothetical protein
MELYRWLIVLKNGKEYLIKHSANEVQALINDLLPTYANENKWNILSLLNPTEDGFNAIVINGNEISNILYRDILCKDKK